MTFDPTKNAPEQNQDTLQTIKNFGDMLSSLSDIIERNEEVVAEAKKKFKEIAEHKLPELMNEIQIDELKLSDGSVIKKEEFVFSRIKIPETAFSWLKEQGEEAIIDNVVGLKFGKGEDQSATDLMDWLSEKGYAFTNKKDVHWKRLESFIKEALADPKLKESLPREAFGVYEGEIVKFKKPKHGK